MAGLNLFTNNAATTLATGINSSVTSLTVASATGGLFPTLAGSQYFYCTLSNTAGTTIEIVKVTARSTDTFTIVRGQDNTTAAAFIAGDKVELRLTAADLQNFPQLDSTNTFSQTQTFVTPILGTPTSGTLTNCTGYTTANLSGSIGLTTQVTGTLPIANGGTNSTTAAGANANLQTYTTTATAAGTTTLTNTSTYYQYFTGVTTQTVVLPVTSTLSLGWSFHIANNSTGNLTLQSSGLNTIATILPNTTAHVTCILTSGTTAASWDYGFTDFNTSVPVALGGTGNTSATAYAVLTGGTTSTGAFQSIASVGTSGQVLTSNGASALPTFQTAAGGGLGGTTAFTSSGTFTIPAGKTVVKVTVQGGGGAGAGAASINSPSTGGAGGGGTAIKYLTGLTPGNTLTVTVGAVKTATTGAGAAGNTSSVASGTQTITTISATGGGAGSRIDAANNNTQYTQTGGAGGSGTNGDVNITGGTGKTGTVSSDGCGVKIFWNSGSGGDSVFGFGGSGTAIVYLSGAPLLATAGITGIGYGAGGSGCLGFTCPANTGGNGSAGIVIFEY